MIAFCNKLRPDLTPTVRSNSVYALFDLSCGLDNNFAILTAATGRKTTAVARIAAPQTTPVKNFFIFFPFIIC